MRTLLIGGLAALGGLAIAYVDSRPTWDDTGITVAALLALAAVTSFLAGQRPWLWAALVGGPLAALEVAQHGDPAPLAAVVVAGVGALVGWTVARVLQRGGDDPRSVRV